MLRVKIFLALILALTTIGLLTACGTDRSNVRFVHAAVSALPDSVDVALDAVVDGKNVATGLSYGEVSPATGYQTVSAGSRTVEMSTTGTTDDLINSTISFAAGRHYTVFASGFVTLPPGANANFSIAAVLLTDDNSAPSSGNVKLRILHAAPFNGASPNPPNLDVYIVPPSTDISTLSPNVSNLIYGQASGYQSVPATSNQIIVTAAGTKTPRIIDKPLDTPAAGQIRTLVVVNDQDTTDVSATPVVLADLN